MNSIRVGVLRGGPSSEYEVSLKTGSNVLKNLKDKYVAVDILIDKEGNWHKGGIKTDPHKILKTIDVVFNAMHGEYGEDGKVQKFLEHFGIPFTGSKSLASAIGMNKLLSKKVYTKNGIKTARYEVVRSESEVDENFIKKIFESFSLPLIVKPTSTGSSVGISKVMSFAHLKDAILKALKYGAVLIEEFIRGREATVGVIEGFRNEEIYALPPVEIKLEKGKFFDYESKYDGSVKEICPGNFTPEEKKAMAEVARLAHKSLGLKHYSRTDMIVTKNGIYALETNTLPGLTSESLFPKSLNAVGCKMPTFLDHVIGMAINRD